MKREGGVADDGVDGLLWHDPRMHQDRGATLFEDLRVLLCDDATYICVRLTHSLEPRHIECILFVCSANIDGI